jgi:hypothetical protein
VTVYKDKESVDPAVVTPVYPTLLDFVPGQIKVLQHLFQSEVLKNFVEFVRRQSLSHPLLQDGID